MYTISHICWNLWYRKKSPRIMIGIKIFHLDSGITRNNQIKAQLLNGVIDTKCVGTQWSVRNGAIRGSYKKTLKNGRNLGMGSGKADFRFICVLRNYLRIVAGNVLGKVGLILVLYLCPSSGSWRNF